MSTSNSSRNRILTRLCEHRPLPASTALIRARRDKRPVQGGDRLPESRLDPELPVRRFDWSLQERIERLGRQLTAVHGELLTVADDWPHRLAQRLQSLGARRLRYGPDGPLAAELRASWPDDADDAAAAAATPASTPTLVPHDQPIEHCREALFGETDASITSCRGAIAETGSLVLWPTPAEPRLLSLVPPIHVVLLEASRIFTTLHEMMVAEDWRAAMPTNALLISGPSKSADIEQTLAYGVHGPARLIVLLRR